MRAGWYRSPEKLNSAIPQGVITSSYGNIFNDIAPLCEGNPTVTSGFPSQRPVTWSFDVLFYLRLTKRRSKQSRRRRFETSSRSLWPHCHEHILGCTPSWDVSYFHNLDFYSLSGKTSYRNISRSLEAARFNAVIIVSLWNLTGILAALLSRYLSNFRTFEKV